MTFLIDFNDTAKISGGNNHLMGG